VKNRKGERGEKRGYIRGGGRGTASLALNYLLVKESKRGKSGKGKGGGGEGVSF